MELCDHRKVFLAIFTVVFYGRGAKQH